MSSCLLYTSIDLHRCAVVCRSAGAAIPAGNAPVCAKKAGIPAENGLNDGRVGSIVFHAGKEKDSLAIIAGRSRRHGPIRSKLTKRRSGVDGVSRHNPAMTNGWRPWPGGYDLPPRRVMLSLIHI